MNKNVEEMSREELIHAYTEVYGGKLSDLGDGYISIKTLREAVALSFTRNLEDEEGRKAVSASSEFGFVEQDEAEELDKEAEAQYEWITIPGSSAKRRRKVK